MMKKYMLLTSVVFLGACGSENVEPVENEGTEDTTEVQEDDVTTSEEVNPEEENEALEDSEQPLEEEETDTQDWFEDLDFDEVQVEAEYEDGSYDADYEYNGGEPEAEIEDSRGGESIDLSGQDALDEMQLVLPELDVTPETSEEELQQAVLEAFGLEDDYQELDIDIEFRDDEELEMEDEA
ncbi:YusW family protein [Alkalicoccus urumqiensis]|uniref:YusW-like protein n=1 Tax=Alkalicoccus urumqiensis TaxID=1548213 RepID=A0A2P6MH82_ALKUR|nr:YusW family protein [Alkalicoccus urumqiensis]PRO65644.1 hypothetical protein C6I21_08975 [Alkalicoccus urumqiensis]